MDLIKPLFKGKPKDIKYAAEHYYQVIGQNGGGHEYNTADLKGGLLNTIQVKDHDNLHDIRNSHEPQSHHR
jgi:hypothetical protein